MLEIERARLDQIIDTIDKTILIKKGGEVMKNDDLFNGLSDKKMQEYQKEAKQRWGSTDAYKQSVQRTKSWTKEDYQKVQVKTNQLTQALADNMDKGFDSAEVQELIVEHKKGIENFYDLSLEMYKNLGQMYVEDKRFTAFYDQFRPGLAVFMRDAINYYRDQSDS